MNRRGLLVVLSGPAGSGKSSIADGMIEQSCGEVCRTITATTRPPRPGEEDGKDYFFISKEVFKDRIGKKGFVEFNEFNGNYYGTPRTELEAMLAQDKVVLLVLDVNGALEIRRQYPTAMLLFVLPPSLDALRERLTKRGTESESDVKNRLAIAEFEISIMERYDHLIINDRLDTAIADSLAIVQVARIHHIRGGELEAWYAGLYRNWHRNTMMCPRVVPAPRSP